MPDANKLSGQIVFPRDAVTAPPRKLRPDDLARLLDEWMQGDEAEQCDTFESLRRGLDESRPEGYKLFP